MKTITGAALVLCAVVCLSAAATAQTPVGALAIDDRRGDRYGWAVDYETTSAARTRALSECGSGCLGGADVRALRGLRGRPSCGQRSVRVGGVVRLGGRRASAGPGRVWLPGSGCTVRVWGCNGPVVEDGLGLDRTARREIQEGLEAAGFDPGGADGMFGPRTRTAIRSWQTSRGARATGYLDAPAVAALRPSVAGQPTFREREPAGAAAASAAAPAAPAAVSAAQQQPPPATAEQENLFWQSIANSTNPAEFEAYLSQFPNGVFRALAEVRLAALRSAANDPPAAVGRPAGGMGTPASGSRVSGAGGVAFGGVAVVDAPRRAGDVFQDCAECPEMVVLAGGGLAMGRYEVTVGEYRAFASATGGGAVGGCITFQGDSWTDPGFPQTDRHPVACMSWEDAQEYVSWLSRRTGALYRLPTAAEWERAASGSQPGCDRLGRGVPYLGGTCPVGSHGSNAAGLSDMVGNVGEWTSDCWEGDCGARIVRGGSWDDIDSFIGPDAGGPVPASYPFPDLGFRVSRTLP